MTQPPQDRPDYPWGPGEADRGERAGAPGAAGPTGAGAAGASEPLGGEGGSRRLGEDAPTSSGAPSSGHGSAPHGSAPAPSAYSGTPAPAPYAGTPVSQLPPLGPPATGGYQGTPAGAPGAGGASTPVSTIVLLVVSGLVLLTTVWTGIGIVFAAPVVLAVVALTRTSADPASARRLTRIGWWIFAGLVVLGVVLVGVLIALAVAFGESTGGFGQNDPFSTTSVLSALAGAGR